jgi:type VI secretion system protein
MPYRPDTLMERLADGGAGARLDDRTRLRQSILRNLRDVLNTRLGNAPAQPDLGTPPPSELVQDYPACIPRLQKSIAEGIGKYEPRLTAVRVVHIHEEGALSLQFQITAMLADGSRTPMSFSTQVEHTGVVKLGG